LELVATTQMVLYNLSIGCGQAFFYLFLSYRFFHLVYRHNLKTGKLARFNASI
jgi:hypothetical protein